MVKPRQVSLSEQINLAITNLTLQCDSLIAGRAARFVLQSSLVSQDRYKELHRTMRLEVSKRLKAMVEVVEVSE
jgi:hypothetical protein